ncbi:alpha-L-rhamnosidase N-terminal domain-containing protein [Sphingomonas sp. LB-2]|uniref:alpha-L-rhamnosidase-related protein n=1 Tax=Sphingomonas caeni TaxID=2984949 RepID=UPI00222E443F|nr:alpha-L-rhamnosidase C-terminal domain-containing protein [Sphingomonas caeni]MCW3849033.1 alpha-L-rhamnosidase N-terminal domain-containing protein [Sphingomonas caeni]
MTARLLALLLTLLALAAPAAAQQRRAFTPWPAKWIAHPDAPAQSAGVFHFRKRFDLAEAPQHFIVHVSADNRYRLFVNGQSVAIGPARGDLMHWRYETIDLAPFLKPGRNLIAALVWNWGEYRPGFQISHRTAFLLHGEGAASVADTGAGWKVLWDRAYGFTRVEGPDAGGWYVASPGETLDAAQYPWGWEQPGLDDSGWPAAKPLVARPDAADGALLRGSEPYGSATEWQLVARDIPPMEETPARFATLRRAEGIAPDPGFLTGTRPLVIPANSRVSLLLDQGTLTMGYPLLSTTGGAGATATLTYAESLFDAQGRKGNRNEIDGKTIRGLRDRITFDGGSRTFQTLWLRTWRYVQLDIQTGAQPLTIADFHSIFTAYPFEQKAAFDSDQDWIPAIWEIDWRMLRLSAFESFWDTPYYEQLQYVGDARIEALLSVYQTGDARLMRHAITLFDESRTPEGITAGSWPSSIPGYIPPFSLWWVAMVHDYWMLRDDPAFVRRQLTGTRGVLDWYAAHVDATGMLGPMEWWNFLDWSGAFDRGVPPGAENGHSTAITLQYVYALQMAVEMEDKVGEPGLARGYREQAARLIAAVRKLAWDPARGLFAETPERTLYTQHSNALAILTGAVPAADARAVMERVLADTTLVPASYYFRFYVDEAMREAGLADRYLDRLAPWREMIRIGLTTTPENPEPTRSDSHAWSAHPNYHLLATVLGIRPASPGFRSVEIAPALGPMRRASGRMPHPAGMIEVRLERVGATGIKGEITLPPGLTGSFTWNGATRPLKPGRNPI